MSKKRKSVSKKSKKSNNDIYSASRLARYGTNPDIEKICRKALRELDKKDSSVYLFKNDGQIELAMEWFQPLPVPVNADLTLDDKLVRIQPKDGEYSYGTIVRYPTYTQIVVGICRHLERFRYIPQVDKRMSIIDSVVSHCFEQLDKTA